MALNAQGYFNCLKSYLHTDDYGVSQPTAGEVVLKEKIHQAQGTKPKEYKLTLKSEGEILVIKLDAKKDRLFHFLDDTAKPWAKRCDFVIFNLRKSKLFTYCVEFKSTTIPPDVPEQLDGNEEIFVRLMNDEAFRNIAAGHLMRAVYQQIKAAGGINE